MCRQRGAANLNGAMMRRSSFLATGLSAVAVLTLVLAAPAQAAPHGRFVSAQGPYGHGYTHYRNVSRQPGAFSISRGTQSNSGRGAVSDRYARWGDGTYSGGASRTFNNGASASRSLNLVDNNDGTFSYDRSRTRYNGTTRSVSGTAIRP